MPTHPLPSIEAWACIKITAFKSYTCTHEYRAPGGFHIIAKSSCTCVLHSFLINSIARYGLPMRARLCVLEKVCCESDIDSDATNVYLRVHVANSFCVLSRADIFSDAPSIA